MNVLPSCPPRQKKCITHIFRQEKSTLGMCKCTAVYVCSAEVSRKLIHAGSYVSLSVSFFLLYMCEAES